MKRVVLLSILLLVFVSFVSSISLSNPEWITEELNSFKENMGKNLIMTSDISPDLFQNNFLAPAFFGISLLLAAFCQKSQVFSAFTVLRE